MKNIYKNKKECSICSKRSLENLIKLNKFPLTGIFIKDKLKKNFPYFFNQGLNICINCGHLQLSKFISPDLLYNNIYANRTTESYLSDNAINFFKNFLFQVLKKKRMEVFLEIGCNDIKLINSLKNFFVHLYGIDPIWKKKKVPKSSQVTVIGDFIEKINFKKIKKKINVIASTHNLEHIDNPYRILKKFVDKYDENTIFFIEVPDANLMIKNLRFDQIFHQHYHYFNIYSLKNLINMLGCKIIAKDINYKFWGGSLVVAFKKDKNIKNKINNQYKKLKPKINQKYKKFKEHYKKLSKKFNSKKNLIGYGAGQMVPSFAYHLNSDLSFLKVIVDDNKKRNKKKYPFLFPDIKFFDKKLLDNIILITALDGVSGITKKLKKLKVEFYNPLSKI